MRSYKEIINLVVSIIEEVQFEIDYNTSGYFSKEEIKKSIIKHEKEVSNIHLLPYYAAKDLVQKYIEVQSESIICNKNYYCRVKRLLKNINEIIQSNFDVCIKGYALQIRNKENGKPKARSTRRNRIVVEKLKQ
jgi:CO dehydrogenase/acetyl-CoA synthase delta subunit